MIAYFLFCFLLISVTINAFHFTSFDLSLLQRVEPDRAKGEFIFFFFGGSGALGIGGAQVPKILKANDELKALAGGPSLGGATIDGIATIGYPEKIRENDVKAILKAIPTVEKLQDLGEKKSYMASLGYVERVAYMKDITSKKLNPVAAYAVFDGLTNGSGDLANPNDIRDKLTAWREDDTLNAFKSDLTKSNSAKFSAYAVFAFLIGIVLDLIIESGLNGWA